MPDETLTLDNLVPLRKTTRAVAERLRTQLKDYLVALTPLLRPKTFLGDLVAGGGRETVSGAERAFQEVMSIYQRVTSARPFLISRDLARPLEISYSPIELNAYEYSHRATAAGGTKTVSVASPLKWVLSYPGCSIAGLRELISQKSPSEQALYSYAVHYSVLSFVSQRSAAVSKVLKGLRFPVTTITMPEFGELPLVVAASEITSCRPADQLIVDSTEISGVNSFEEVINLEALASLQDPLRSQVDEVVAAARASA